MLEMVFLMLAAAAGGGGGVSSGSVTAIVPDAAIVQAPAEEQTIAEANAETGAESAAKTSTEISTENSHAPAVTMFLGSSKDDDSSSAKPSNAPGAATTFLAPIQDNGQTDMAATAFLAPQTSDPTAAPATSFLAPTAEPQTAASPMFLTPNPAPTDIAPTFLAPATPGLTPGLVAEPQTPTGRFTTATEVKPILNATRANWISVREFDGKSLLYVTHLWSWRCGLVQMRIGVNGNTPDVWPMPPCHLDQQSPAAILEGDGLPYGEFAPGSLFLIEVEITYDDLSTDRARFNGNGLLVP